ncbi:putative Zn finger-like uncharacterized protein [Yoonia maritima]|uniref:Putative Zn finger-like uncharacterized protein n=1 Tax=Yoonia maritima TaxID=1435347 RepID=A0A2T0VTX4_9RHOB|nr:zinc-ribbon domain-containing protein [Yoonia maritima]PRY74799.1 putative Zn finger-like uncharacterized protein [Yoonia maritima]
MRLICPKCNAQYDIASDAIPEGGRDVQCSSCSHTWFQTEQTPPAASTVVPTPPPAPVSSPASDVEAAITKRKPLDSSIADILRQEAARENTGGLAPTPTPDAPAQQDIREPALTRPAETINKDETRRRISMMAAEDTTTPATVAAAATGAVAAAANMRSVPSIDEINEQLRARSQNGDGSNLTEVEQQEVAQRRGFRRGFTLMLLLLAILIAPYFFADKIIDQLPQLADPMESYVEIVDNTRLWLNDQFQNARGLIEGFTGAEDATAPAVDTAPPSAPTAPPE